MKIGGIEKMEKKTRKIIVRIICEEKSNYKKNKTSEFKNGPKLFNRFIIDKV